MTEDKKLNNTPILEDSQQNFEAEPYPAERYTRDLSPQKSVNPVIENSNRLTKILSNLQRGWKIAVLREQPTWCRGHLETIEFFGEDDTFIDIDYLVRVWGGQKLHIKVHDENGRWQGGGSISLYSYPPRVRGKLLHEADVLGSLSVPATTQATGMPSYTQPPPQQGLDIGKIFDLMSKQKNMDIGGLVKLLEFSRATQMPTVAQTPNNLVDQMTGFAQLFRQMRDLFGDLGGNAGGADDGIGPMATELIKGLMQRQQPASVPNISTPMNRVIQPPRNPNPPINTNKIENPNSINELAQKISRLDANDAAGVVLLALEKMPENKREEAMQNFLSTISDEEIDDEFVSDDNYDTNVE